MTATPSPGRTVAGTADDAAVGAVFAALADPTRRAVLRELGAGATVTASALADRLPMTRQAVTKHLRALADAGLVVASRSGRETHYGAVSGALDDAVGWMVDAGARWDDRLERLRRRVET
jgi:DNA-binding transcriptional ArsR family regulator